MQYNYNNINRFLTKIEQKNNYLRNDQKKPKQQPDNLKKSTVRTVKPIKALVSLDEFEEHKLMTKGWKCVQSE